MMTKKTVAAPPTEEFRIPTLAEASADYGALVERQARLNASHAELLTEQRRLQHEISNDPTPKVRPGVAALLGDDPVDGKAARASQLAEVRRSIVDHEVALETIRSRLAQSRGSASIAVCDAVRPEYRRRVTALCDALAAVDEARSAYEKMRLELEANDVEWTRLVPISLNFLGDRDGGRSFHVTRVIREAREAGNYVA